MQMKNRSFERRAALALAKLRSTSIDVLEGTLEAWAKQHAQGTGLSFAKAYDDLLQNDEDARDLYAELRQVRSDPSLIAKRREAFRKSSIEEAAKPSSEAERELDEMASECARKKSITKAVAYDEVLQSDDGRALYAKIRSGRATAA